MLHLAMSHQAAAAAAAAAAGWADFHQLLQQTGWSTSAKKLINVIAWRAGDDWRARLNGVACSEQKDRQTHSPQEQSIWLVILFFMSTHQSKKAIICQPQKENDSQEPGANNICRKYI